MMPTKRLFIVTWSISQLIQGQTDDTLRECGMFKFHKKKYLSGVEDFHTFTNKEVT